MATKPVECTVNAAAAQHVSSRLSDLGARIADGSMGKRTTAITLSGNARINVNGSIDRGALIVVSLDTPLADARRLMGETLYGRVGVYLLREKPPGLETISQVQRRITESDVVRLIDSHGEDYDTFSATTPDASPWVPQLDNGHSSDNFVAILRSTQNDSRYAVVVHSNATPQAEVAIRSALKKNPAITLREFLASDEHRRLSERSTEQNERVAASFALHMGFPNLINIQSHPKERTSDDDFAAPVQYAVPDGMAIYGEARREGHDKARISNHTFDLYGSVGHVVPLVHSPYHGVTLVRGNPNNGCVRPAGVQPLGTIAAVPHTGDPAPMGAEEVDQLERVLHYPNKDQAVTSLVSARISAVDSAAAAHSEEQIKLAGLGHLEREKYRTFGAIVFP